MSSFSVLLRLEMHAHLPVLQRFLYINKIMQYTIEKTDEFNAWQNAMKDRLAKQMVSIRIMRAEQGNFGKHKSLRNGVSEMKIDIGKGYRVYYTIRQQKIILLLLGGDKSTQDEDIKKAIKIAEQIK